ncbi:MAG: DUF262 domain-containing HNH endonuclease family protein [Mucispirillum sp.]|nr:DUF262 domain-containing HNH endonuclease family protein [Mucispirillum sp.]
MMVQSQPVLIREFLEKNDFIIPTYQRPYKWEIDPHCEDLWNDAYNAYNEKDGGDNKNYFFGSIVVFKRDDGKYEIIDGQQRITSFILLFRAFYETFKTEDKTSRLSEEFAKCVWDTELNDEANGINIKYDNKHLNSDVINDKSKEIFDKILSDSNIADLDTNNKSNYMQNYTFFYNKLIEEKSNHSITYKEFCKFFLEDDFKKGGLYILPIICNNQETALTIFNTLNSRGMPLENSDLIKSHLYKYYKGDEEKLNEFLNIWTNIEKIIEEGEKKQFDKGLDTLFLQLMYIIKAENEDKSTTTYNILDFFTKKNNKSFYGADNNWLYKTDTLPFLKNLAEFWLNPSGYLSNKTYIYFKILENSTNATWKYFVAYLVWRNKDLMYKIILSNNEEQEYLKDEFSKEFNQYLPVMIKKLVIATLNGNVGTNVVTNIVLNLNVDIKKSEKIQYDKMISEESFIELFSNNTAQYIKFLLYLYSNIYDNFSDSILKYNGKLQIEHILPRSWQKANFDDWTEETHKEYVEHIGNKILLDYKINIACSNNFFARKKDEYKKSKMKEVQDIGNSKKNKWLIIDIEQRASEIYQKIKEFVEN